MGGIGGGVGGERGGGKGGKEARLVAGRRGEAGGGGVGEGQQWRTEERVRGSEPLPLAYGLRNKRVRMRQNMAFSTKNTKHFLGTVPSPDPSISREGIPAPHAHPPRSL